MRICIGIIIGATIVSLFPEIVPIIKSAFLDSGARDLAVDSLTNIK